MSEPKRWRVSHSVEYTSEGKKVTTRLVYRIDDDPSTWSDRH